MHSLGAVDTIASALGDQLKYDHDARLGHGKSTGERLDGGWESQALAATVVQADSGKQPLFTSNGGPKNKPFLTFAKARGDYLEVGSLSDIVNGSFPYIGIVVKRISDPGVNAATYTGSVNGGATQVNHAWRISTSQGRWAIRDSGGFRSVLGDWSTSAWEFWEARSVSGTSCQVWRNGTSLGTSGTDTSGIPATIDTLTIGEFNDGGAPDFHMTRAFMAVDVTDAQRVSIAATILDLYGI